MLSLGEIVRVWVFCSLEERSINWNGGIMGEIEIV